MNPFPRPGGVTPSEGTDLGIQNPLIPQDLRNLSGTEFISRLISTLVTLILIIGAVAFIFMLLVGALQWITSGGDKASVEGARNRMTHALIGLILLFSAFAIISVVEAVFGIDILAINIAPLIIGN